MSRAAERLGGPDAALEIGRLAFGHFGLRSDVCYAPAIHPARNAIARARIAVDARAEEPLVALQNSVDAMVLLLREIVTRATAEQLDLQA